MLALDWPFVKVGDDATLEAWRLQGFDDTNTDRGRVHIESTVVGSTLTVAGYRSIGKESGSKVFEGTGGATGARLTLAATNSSRLSGSVYVREVRAKSSIVMSLALASEQDIFEREDRAKVMVNSERINFADILRATSRAFYTRIAERFPPPVSVGRSLGFPGSSPAQEAGRFGRPDAAAYYVWGMNVERAFELVGLNNPTDYREWAIQDSLARIWQAKAGGGAEDPMLSRAAWHIRSANDEWARITPWVDIDGDGGADRPARTKGIRLRRG